MSKQNSEKPYKIQTTALGYKIYHYNNVYSTNDTAKEIAKKTSEERIVVLAEAQTRGKGRLGRRWISPKGGVWLSIILRPRITPIEALKLTFITSSAVAKTIKTMFGLMTEVKWPNDVLVNGRKICGILTETSSKRKSVESMVVGVGINANIDLECFSPSLRDAVTSLQYELGHKIKRKALTRNLLRNFEHRYKCLQRGLWNALLQEWKSMATFLGEQVQITSFDDVLAGEAWDIDEDGALVIRLENGTLEKVVVGDLTLRKQP
ncbi:MAG: biotin--[acetyl-CoA-carboxylase] ligase [Candidatus Bathyarchaeota archaeon]|nr:biotin--[acetyl-CoA-carboxylase] ligase [Candidatus Bathyarchaeota archaeon]MDH5495487.1 biotin--[acetyl-CoA-carboxylase] ligase [Candidatus Bathyarchaeota archaeon]